jgi:low temperature requirement protein LtrA
LAASKHASHSCKLKKIVVMAEQKDAVEMRQLRNRSPERAAVTRGPSLKGGLLGGYNSFEPTTRASSAKRQLVIHLVETIDPANPLEPRILDALALVLKLSKRQRARLSEGVEKLKEDVCNECELKVMFDLPASSENSQGRSVSRAAQTLLIEDYTTLPAKIVFPIVQDMNKLDMIRFPRDSQSHDELGMSHRDNQAQEKERNATWLELMFDVFFVAVLRILSHSQHSSASQLTLLIFKFVVIWWGWLSVILYDTKYDTDDLFHRSGKLFQMLAVAGFALSIEHALENVLLSNMFAVSYILIHIILLLNYSLVSWSAFKHGNTARQKKYRFQRYIPILSSSFLTIVLVASSIGLGDMYTSRAIMWGVAMLQEAIAHLYSFSVGYQTPFKGSHLPERMGLFTIIVIGEGVIGVLTESAAWITKFALESYGNPTVAVETVALCLIAVVIYYCLWSAYFDDFANSIVIEETADHQFQLRKHQDLYDRVRYLWILLHLGVHLFHALFGIYMVDAVIFVNSSVQKSLISTTPSLSTTILPTSTLVWPPLPPAIVATAAADTFEMSGSSVARQLIFIKALLFLFNAFIKFLGYYKNDQAKLTFWSVLSRSLISIIIFCLLAIPPSSFDYAENVFWLVVVLCVLCLIQLVIDLVIQYLVHQQFKRLIYQPGGQVFPSPTVQTPTPDLLQKSD